MVAYLVVVHGWCWCVGNVTLYTVNFTCFFFSVFLQDLMATNCLDKPVYGHITARPKKKKKIVEIFKPLIGLNIAIQILIKV